jgi:hypothetical protein
MRHWYCERFWRWLIPLQAKAAISNVTKIKTTGRRAAVTAIALTVLSLLLLRMRRISLRFSGVLVLILFTL